MPDTQDNKPGVKVQDLSPRKDAKGGGGKTLDGAINPTKGTINPNANVSPDKLNADGSGQRLN